MNGADALSEKPPSKPDPTPAPTSSATKHVETEAIPQLAPPEETKTSELDEWGLPVKKRPQASNAEPIDPSDQRSDEKSKIPAVPSKDENSPPKDNSRDEGSSDVKETGELTEVNLDSKSEAKVSAPSAAENKSDKRISNSAGHVAQASAWSHQQLAPGGHVEEKPDGSVEDWQTMPAFAPFDIYNDDGKLIAREAAEEEEEDFGGMGNLGGAAKGYTRVQMDEDAQSATSMDDNTAYLFKEPTTNVLDEDEELRDMQTQMQTTKTLLTEGQRIAYVGIVRLAIIEMLKELSKWEKTRKSKKVLDHAIEHMTMWSQMIMLRLYSHMEIESAEQIMIEQLSGHGVQPEDLTPSLMQNARVKNPMREENQASSTSLDVPSNDSDRRPSSDSRLSPLPQEPEGEAEKEKSIDEVNSSASSEYKSAPSTARHSEDGKSDQGIVPVVKDVSEFANQKNIDIDIRWTVLCDLFLLLIADANYDSRSRRLLELVGEYLDVSWLDICRFEKRVTDALEMQEAANRESWNEEEHMATRRKEMRNRRLVVMGLATVGGGIVIGLSAGLLAPLIGAGLAAGFTTFGVAGTSGFLAGAGGAAIITTTGVVTGSNIAFKASNRRTGSVKTFEYRPLHNNKRVNLIVTVAGWLTGKVDDVRLPFSTVDPIMGDIYSVFWEPEMLQSMGDTINILATEALTQGLQQILGSTILVALMAALQLPIVLTKLAYLIDNPWTVSLARADLAGLILADSLMDRNLGARPITLVGFSLGTRVIYACLKELVKRGQLGIIQNIYMFGSPVVVNKDEYINIRSIISGRFVNAYATNDWILGYLFRATSGGVRRVAGLAPVEIPGIENYNVTEWVPGHMSYRAAMPRLLREVGWTVESDEFTEIEDPDPENHEKRQRELINEIEEARKQLEEKPAKNRFGISLWKRKKAVEKKDWEMYDEKLREGSEENKDALEGKASGVLFDIDALRAEVAELAAQGIIVKELPESTLPPMKLDLTQSPKKRLSIDDRSQSAPPAKSTFSTPPASASLINPESGSPAKKETQILAATAAAGTVVAGVAIAKSGLERSNTAPEQDASSLRPTLSSAVTAPVAPINLEHNAWADEFEDDFGKEREMTMTFE